MLLFQQSEIGTWGTRFWIVAFICTCPHCSIAPLEFPPELLCLWIKKESHAGSYEMMSDSLSRSPWGMSGARGMSAMPWGRISLLAVQCPSSDAPQALESHLQHIIVSLFPSVPLSHEEMTFDGHNWHKPRHHKHLWRFSWSMSWPVEKTTQCSPQQNLPMKKYDAVFSVKSFLSSTPGAIWARETLNDIHHMWYPLSHRWKPWTWRELNSNNTLYL